MYCLDADNVPNFLWGFSYNGPWVNASLAEGEYGTNSSALPASLELANVVLPHNDSCAYQGDLIGRKTDLQAQFVSSSSYTCVDTRILLYPTENPTSSPTTTDEATTSPTTVAPTTMSPTTSPTMTQTGIPTLTPTLILTAGPQAPISRGQCRQIATPIAVVVFLSLGLMI